MDRPKLRTDSGDGEGPDQEEAGQASAAPKQRRCLSCRAEFSSEWVGERVCRRCKQGPRWRDGLWQSDDGAN